MKTPIPPAAAAYLAACGSLGGNARARKYTKAERSQQIKRGLAKKRNAEKRP